VAVVLTAASGNKPSTAAALTSRNARRLAIARMIIIARPLNRDSRTLVETADNATG
jgi:hypothetical protein